MSNLIITENYLKEGSVINGNADMKIITPTILLCQDKYIKTMLGTDLFNQILSQIDSSTPGTNDQVSALNVTLLDSYILPALMWYTLCECTPVFKYRYANKGVMVKNSENSQPADLNEIQWLMDKWRNNAEWYAEQGTKYLNYKAASYPLYLANTECYKITPNKTNFTTGLFLKD